MAETLNITRGSAAPSAGTPSLGITRDAPDDIVTVGVSYKGLTRGRLFTYDKIDGLKNKGPVTFKVNKPDRLGDDEYRERSRQLEVLLGLDEASDGQKAEFYDALYVSYALIGGSQLTPGSRASFTVHGVTHYWNVIIDFWGEDLRRAFKTVADLIIVACKEIWLSKDVLNEEVMMLRKQIQQTADLRGVGRKPWLLADCCDGAYEISAEERTLVMSAKYNVIGTSYNAVDRRNLVHNIQSAEGYDSSNGEILGNAINSANINYR